MKKLLTAALIASTTAFAADIYVGNCDATNTAVKSRRSCYTCCNDQNGTSVETSNCQTSCDGTWARSAPIWMPLPLVGFITDSRGDWHAQLDLLSDEELWDWLAIADGDTVNPFVVEIADWFWQNAADETVARSAIVTLAWLQSDHALTVESQMVVEVAIVEALRSPSPQIRRGALIAVKETDALLNNPAIVREMIRITVEDKDQSVRDTGLRVLGDR
jgi:hypothetical protein